MGDFINTIDVLGDDAVVDSIIDKTITEFKDDVITTFNNNASFRQCEKLITVDLPNLELISANLFNGCTALTSVNLPEADVQTGGGVDYGMGAFTSCTSIRKIALPKITRIPGYFFHSCSILEIVDLSSCTNAGRNYSFNKTSLRALILRNTEAVASVGSISNNFSGTPLHSGNGYIYVPSALIEEYKVATNWATYADQFRALEDYTIDGTVTGELDESKI